MRKLSLLLFLCLFSFTASLQASVKWDLLSEEEKGTLDSILTHWETWVPARKADGTAPMMTFAELYKGLSDTQKELLNRVRKINPQSDFNFQGAYLGEERGDVEFVALKNQKIVKDSGEEALPTQYLPRPVHEAYQVMMGGMKADLGRALLVESGYRSPAYQLYTFLFYTPKHHYSLVETGRWVALPGYSEHGAPFLQAIDFINEKGINGEDDVRAFEQLPEYEWLLKHAASYGFELSYPRNQPGITFEPWHWRYTRNLKK